MNYTSTSALAFDKMALVHQFVPATTCLPQKILRDVNTNSA